MADKETTDELGAEVVRLSHAYAREFDRACRLRAIIREAYDNGDAIEMRAILERGLQ